MYEPGMKLSYMQHRPEQNSFVGSNARLRPVHTRSASLEERKHGHAVFLVLPALSTRGKMQAPGR